MKYVKKNQIRTVITAFIAVMLMNGVPHIPDVRAQQITTEDIIEQQQSEIEAICTEYTVPEEPIVVEDVVSTMTNDDTPTITLASEECIIEQVETQQQIMEGEKERIRLEKIAQEEAKRQAQIESITADPNDITKVSNLTKEQYTILVKGTWWEGHEQTLIDLEKKYGINAFFAMSVSTLESGKGTSRIAQTKHNYYGAKVAKTFNGLHDNTMYFGDFLNRLYVDNNLVSVWSIGPKYCPPNRNWERSISSNMKELYNKVMVTLK